MRTLPLTQLTLVFYSFFKTLVDQEVTVELKNDLAIKGILKSVDQFLNIKLDEISVLEEDKYPHLVHPRNPPNDRLRLKMCSFEDRW
jgi:small nuclear ribonucleoprotein (snRNP)-like protein